MVSRACPWADRAIIVRRLLGLEDALSMGVAGPTHDWRSWQFDLDPGGRDPVLATEWTALHRDGAPDLWPEPLRDEMTVV